MDIQTLQLVLVGVAIAAGSLCLYSWSLNRKLKKFFSIGQKLELEFNSRTQEFERNRKQLSEAKSELEKALFAFAKSDSELVQLQTKYQESLLHSSKALEIEKKKVAEASLLKEHLLEQVDALTSQLKEIVIEKQTLLTDQRKSMDSKKQQIDQEIAELQKELKNLQREMMRKDAEMETQKQLFTETRLHLEGEASKKIKRYNELYLGMRNLRELAEDKSDQLTTVALRLANWVLAQKQDPTGKSTEQGKKSGASQTSDSRAPHMILMEALEAAGVKAFEEFTSAELSAKAQDDMVKEL